MILSAQLLDSWDRCERRYAYEQRYELRFISPLGLLYAALESAIISDDPEQAAKDTCLAIAQEKEIKSDQLNGISAVRHVGLLAGIVALALQSKFGPLVTGLPVPFGPHLWKSGLFSGHRIVLTSSLDDDSLRSHAHSWAVIGELAALERPVRLTHVQIGASRRGRRVSPWTKGLMHPVNHALRFRKQAGEFKETWVECWRESHMEIPSGKWLEQMQADGVLDELIATREIPYNPDDARIRQARADMLAMAERMSGEDAPMRRSSCDTPWGQCPFAFSCWSRKGETPAELPHLYRDRLPEAPASRRLKEDSVSSPRPLPVFRTGPGLPGAGN